jgi:hypothetical protein
VGRGHTERLTFLFPIFFQIEGALSPIDNDPLLVIRLLLKVNFPSLFLVLYIYTDSKFYPSLLYIIKPQTNCPFPFPIPINREFYENCEIDCWIWSSKCSFNVVDFLLVNKLKGKGSQTLKWPPRPSGVLEIGESIKRWKWGKRVGRGGREDQGPLKFLFEFKKFWASDYLWDSPDRINSWTI